YASSLSLTESVNVSVLLANSSVSPASFSPSSVERLNHFTNAIIPVVKSPIPPITHPIGPIIIRIATPNAFDAAVIAICATVARVTLPVNKPIANVPNVICLFCNALINMSACAALVDACCTMVSEDIAADAPTVVVVAAFNAALATCIAVLALVITTYAPYAVIKPIIAGDNAFTIGIAIFTPFANITTTGVVASITDAIALNDA